MKKAISVCITCVTALAMSGPPAMAMDLEGLVDAGFGLFRAATVSDEEINALCAASIQKSDKEKSFIG